jgi:multidrug efflux system outer membrane protein
MYASPWGRLASVGLARNHRPFSALLFAIALMPAVAGCKLMEGRLDPALDIPNSYRWARGAPDAALPPLDWWRCFRSSELTDLIEQAQAANLDIAAAVARIIEADANARIAGAPLLPNVNMTASATHLKRSTAVMGGGSSGSSSSGGGGGGASGGSGGGASGGSGGGAGGGGGGGGGGGASGGSGGGGASGGSGSSGRSSSGGRPTEFSIYNVALNASYVVDFWGRNRDLLRAAESSASASRFDREVVALTTLVGVANTYFLVLEGQDLLRIAKKNLVASERVLKLIQDRFNNGTAAALDVAQQASLTAIVRASIPPLMQQVEQNRAALALLVGRVPEHIRIGGGSMFSLAVPRVTPGLPSELLVRRPDVREAEDKLAAANANVAAARAAFFPTIQLTAQGGFQSLALGTLFGPGTAFYTVASSLTQPIFDGGTLLGQLDLQKGTREELLQDYRKAVISAFTDVERALVAVQQTTQQEQLQRDAVRESRRAFELSEERLRAGTIDIVTLLQAEQTWFQQETTLAQVRFARLQAIVSLFQALGGGWQLDLADRAASSATLRALRHQ